MAEKELPLYGLKCSVCGLGFLSWSKEHVGELLALHEADHVKRFTRLEACVCRSSLGKPTNNPPLR